VNLPSPASRAACDLSLPQLALRSDLRLGESKQHGGKIVHIWGGRDDWDAAKLQSNVFEMEWPPRSGRRQKFPELDRAAGFSVAEARGKILKGQAVFLNRLMAALADAMDE
jgi:predicted NUDIX family NTP pyrophosphohydrolase